jgi:hypothetical protein
VCPAPPHHQKDNPYKATLYQDQVCITSAVPRHGPLPKISLLMKNSVAWKASSEWTPASAPGVSSHRQEPTTCYGHPAPEPPTRQKQLTWKQLSISGGGGRLDDFEILFKSGS